MNTERKQTKKDMPYIVMVIDEFADLMYVGKKQTERFVQKVAQKRLWWREGQRV